MRRIIVQLALSFFGISIVISPQAARSEQLYQATAHLLAADGTYNKYVLKETQKGVGKVECELRRDAWIEKFGGAIEAAKSELATEGRQGGIKMTCDPISN